MLRSRDANAELREVEPLTKAQKDDTIVVTIGRAILKVCSIVAKLVRDVKTNQVTIMKHQGIELVKDERPTEEKSEIKKEK